MADTLYLDPAETLFVSDLDGTLRTPGAVLPKGAVEKIRALSDRGVRLTYATARTIRSTASTRSCSSTRCSRWTSTTTLLTGR